MLRKLLFICLAIFEACGFLYAQNRPHQNQITIISENDSYTSIARDGYYTNGLQISYQWRKLATDSLSKKRIRHIELGQYIFNAENVQYSFSRVDRPITGYVFVNYQQSNFNSKGDLFRWKAELGAIGPPALGEQTQESIHRWFDVYAPRQWEYQLRPGWGLTGTASWHPEINRAEKKGIRIGLKPVVGASLGNMFTNVMIGSGVLFGKFNKNSSSAFWYNHQSSDKRQREFYIYMYPALYLQAYNATVQGNMFNNEREIFEGKLNPFFLRGKIGATYAVSKYSLGFAVVYENKQSLTQRSRQVYGSAQLAFRW